MNRHHKMLIAWFVISGLIVFTAVRQIQVAAAEKLRTHQPLPPPLKTRHAIRPVVPPWSGDPVADYVARCAKGMTDKEIGCILEDFRSAGLDQLHFTEASTDEELFAYRVAQNRWYRDALVDGLRLNPEQSAQVAIKLLDQLQKLKAGFERNKREDGQGLRTPFAKSRIDLIFSPYWLMGADDYEIPDYSTFLPWDLCSLTPQQEQLTWKKEYLAERDSDTSVEFPPHPLFKNSHPMDDQNGGTEPWGVTDTVFPFLKSQTVNLGDFSTSDSDKSLLETVRLLHPAQFKVLILLFPGLARELQFALDLEIH